MGRRRRLGLVLAVALTAGGVYTLLTSETEGRPRTARLGGNLPVDDRALDPLSQGVRNSPALAANPRDARNLVVANRVDAPEFGCDLHVSTDGGASWRQASLPAPPAGPERETQCFSPDAAFGADGRLYVAFTSFGTVPGSGTVPDAVWVATSDDGGSTFAPPVQVNGPNAFEVRLAADPSDPDVLYVVWVQAADVGSFGFTAPGNPILVSRSGDGGATWQPPARATPARRQRVVAPVPAVGADGTLYVAYLDVGDDVLDYVGAHEGKPGPAHAGPWALVVARWSEGSRWAEKVVDPAIVPATRFLVLFPPTPALVADQRGDRVYVGFHDARSGDADVRVWSSDDRGRSWSAGRRVNDTRPADGTDQYLPGLAVSPDGRLDVAYYDRRRDGRNIMNEVSLQSSVDGGRTFTTAVPLSDRPFDSRIGVSPDRRLEIAGLGHRLAVLASDAGALALWADTRASSAGLGRQDVASALVSIRKTDERSPLRMGVGVALAVVGLAAAAGALRTRRPAAVDGTGGGQPA